MTRTLLVAIRRAERNRLEVFRAREAGRGDARVGPTVTRGPESTPRLPAALSVGWQPLDAPKSERARRRASARGLLDGFIRADVARFDLATGTFDQSPDPELGVRE